MVWNVSRFLGDSSAGISWESFWKAKWSTSRNLRENTWITDCEPLTEARYSRCANAGLLKSVCVETVLVSLYFATLFNYRRKLILWNVLINSCCRLTVILCFKWHGEKRGLTRSLKHKSIKAAIRIQKHHNLKVVKNEAHTIVLKQITQKLIKRIKNYLINLPKSSEKVSKA